MHPGEVGLEIALVIGAGEDDGELAERIDALLRRTGHIARALTDAEQAALKPWVGEDSTRARKLLQPE